MGHGGQDKEVDGSCPCLVLLGSTSIPKAQDAWTSLCQPKEWVQPVARCQVKAVQGMCCPSLVLSCPGSEGSWSNARIRSRPSASAYLALQIN